MLSSQTNGDPDEPAAKMGEPDDQTRSLGCSLAATELDGNIKKLSSRVQAEFPVSGRLLTEMAQLRELLKFQLAMARRLTDELPATYFQPVEAFPITDPGFDAEPVQPPGMALRVLAAPEH